HDQPWQPAVAGGVFGLGLGLAYASMINLIVQNVPAHQTGVASGMNTNVRTVGASIGTAVVSSIITGNPQGNGLPHESDYIHGFLVVTVILAVTVAVALLVPSGRRRTTPGAAPLLEPLAAAASSPARAH
ncbi:MAG: hypothetical protein ACRDOO_25020, partial [Actinomadura sp.]